MFRNAVNEKNFLPYPYRFYNECSKEGGIPFSRHFHSSETKLNNAVQNMNNIQVSLVMIPSLEHNDLKFFQI